MLGACFCLPVRRHVHGLVRCVLCVQRYHNACCSVTSLSRSCNSAVQHCNMSYSASFVLRQSLINGGIFILLFGFVLSQPSCLAPHLPCLSLFLPCSPSLFPGIPFFATAAASPRFFSHDPYIFSHSFETARVSPFKVFVLFWTGGCGKRRKTQD
ncbi:hypothetical protein GGI42DRAFT_312566 [Trichoderma sp. SZMC 28013]